MAAIFLLFTFRIRVDAGYVNAYNLMKRCLEYDSGLIGNNSGLISKTLRR